MKMIARLVDKISEELEGAEGYAEQYLEFRSLGLDTWAMKYREMANDELKHAMIIHSKATEDIERLKKVYMPPQNMLDKWNEIHHDYVEKSEQIKTMIGS